MDPMEVINVLGFWSMFTKSFNNWPSVSALTISNTTAKCIINPHDYTWQFCEKA